MKVKAVIFPALVIAYFSSCTQDSFVSCAQFMKANPGVVYPEHCKLQKETTFKVNGYFDQFCLEPGKKYSLYASTGIGEKSVNVENTFFLNLATQEKVESTLSNMTVKESPCKSFRGKGCQYPRLGKVTVPLGLKPGVYKFIFDDVQKGSVNICVRRSTKEKVQVGVWIPEWTYHAYSAFGSGSLYYHYDMNNKYEQIPAPEKKYEVSLRRPLPDVSRYHSILPLGPALKILDDNQISYEVFGSMAAHAEELISKDRFDVILMLGHNEYWSIKQYEDVQDFIKAGGNILNLSGNIQWWFVNYSDENIRVMKRSTKSLKPDDSYYETGRCNYQNIARQPEKLFGISYEYAGYPLERIKKSLMDLEDEGFAFYVDDEDDDGKANRTLMNLDKSLLDKIVIKPNDSTMKVVCDHPVLKASGLKVGDFLGSESKIISDGVELDGIRLTSDLKIDPTFGLLPNSEIQLFGTSVTFSRKIKEKVTFGIGVDYQPFGPSGGRVFSIGSINYFKGFENPSLPESKIYINALDYLLKKERPKSTCKILKMPETPISTPRI